MGLYSFIDHCRYLSTKEISLGDKTLLTWLCSYINIAEMFVLLSLRSRNTAFILVVKI